MSSQMYSRYVPSKNRTKTIPVLNSNSPAPIPNPPSVASPPATIADASSTYTRYVPPSKSKPQTQTSVTEITTTESPSLSKRKREELTDANPVSEPSPKKSKSANSIAITNTDDQDQHKSNGKELKTDETGKKRKKIKAPSLPLEGEHVATEDDTEDQRHQRVLQKREKSLKKAERLAQRAAEEVQEPQVESVPETEPEVHDLIPLPQPEPIPEPQPQSALASLPPWLSSPIHVAPTTTCSFSDIGIKAEVVKALQAKGFAEAFAVQAAVLPLLLPGKQQQPGDVLVSAATGSGKTLSYVLPMIENISKNTVTRLRGLIVMPTRELVTQAQEVCEICASAYSIGGRRVRIGIAVGNQTLKTEQASLMDQDYCYDPHEYERQKKRIDAKWEGSDDGNDADDEVLCEDESDLTFPDHVMKPISKIDILICTPGRLVEHLKSTAGFSLEFVNWLVVDEADKLLDQSFQQWLEVVISRIGGSLPSNNEQIRKVILSATMTRDIGQLNSLKLYRPKLVVLEGFSYDENTVNEPTSANILPDLLVETAIKVEDDGDKPLYLLDLFRTKNMVSKSNENRQARTSSVQSSSDSSGDSSDSSSDDSTDDSSDDESFSASTSSSSSVEAEMTNKVSPKENAHGVLVFTKSNETAVRLSRLIALLEPELEPSIGTLTSTTRNSARKAALNSFQAGKISILVASDLVSRGLDLPNLAHVINYDIPTSLTSYVHRVGRTARAGKQGFAWTLLGNTEARWFWNEIARSTSIERSSGSKVVRMSIDSDNFPDEMRAKYAKALERLGKEAASTKMKR